MQNIVLIEDKQDFRTREAFKTLRSNIEFAGEDMRVIAITSCISNEGKSSVSFQLAKTFADSGKKVLLIDADLRKSVMRNRYKVGKVRLGLVHYLAGRKNFDEVLCETDIPNFKMIFAGPVPPNPSELLGNRRFEELLEQAKISYDYILIDTPPLGSVIDSAVVAQRCDGMALVIASGMVSYRFAQKVKQQMEKVDCRILGCILNKVKMTGRGYHGLYEKYYDKTYGDYGNDE